MISRARLCLLSCLILAVTKASSSSLVSEEDRTTDAIIDWVRSNGGYWNDKIKIQRVSPTPDVSYRGVFAVDDLDANEKIMNIPPQCYIQVWDVAKRMDYSEEEDHLNMENYHENVCSLMRKMKHEMEQGEQSAFAPYVAYLQQQARGQTPATWSAQGRDFLRQFLSDGKKDVVDWIEMYYEGCVNNGETATSLEESRHLLAMTVQRCYDTALIPLWDMVNHDNGHINTNTTSIYADEGVTVWASQPIAAGEEILATYDLCVDCLGIDGIWGTPEILKDFGFVERSTQRWVYPQHEIWFEMVDRATTVALSSGMNGTAATKKVLLWDDDEYYLETGGDAELWGPPKNSSATDFLVTELHRLRNVVVDNNTSKGIPSFEYNTALQYREAALNAMVAAVQAITAPTPMEKDDTHDEAHVTATQAVSGDPIVIGAERVS